MRLQKVISHLQPEIFRNGDFQLVKIAHKRALLELQNMQFDGLLVESESVLKEVLMNDQLYLTPVFILSKTNRSCDGHVLDENDPTIRQKLEILLPEIESYKDEPLPHNNSKRLLTKVVRYLISRRSELRAINSRSSAIGYNFPLIEDLSIEADPLHIIKNLNEYATQDYFRKQTIDKVNICYECQGSYLNFSECCTKCNSLDLKSEELVHHFRCAYVGPQSDFVKDEKLICPKCTHQLKHIGIDYDKPSEIHTCQSCNHSSQETKMKAKCVDCNKKNELDQLTTHDICNYFVTEKAKSLAQLQQGSSVFQKVEPKVNTVLINKAAYSLIKSHESRKAKNSDTDTYNMIISVDDQLLSQLNSGMQLSLLEELATIIKPYLLINDLLMIDDQKNINTLLIDYPKATLDELIDVLHYNLNKMLRDNGWGKTDLITISANSIRS